jgi:hypothetical protein
MTPDTDTGAVKDILVVVYEDTTPDIGTGTEDKETTGLATLEIPP